MNKCVGCKKVTRRHGVPFTVCARCEKVIENFFKAREQLKSLHRKRFGIKELKFKGDDDMAYNLNSLSSRLANIEEEVAWVKNILSNLAVQSDTEVEVR
ncbi:MAG: hypothetical protein PVI03_02020 [Candidatus Thorarchaeota archaeon]|jgi:hypothetical protein